MQDGTVEGADLFDFEATHFAQARRVPGIDLGQVGPALAVDLVVVAQPVGVGGRARGGVLGEDGQGHNDAGEGRGEAGEWTEAGHALGISGSGFRGGPVSVRPAPVGVRGWCQAASRPRAATTRSLWRVSSRPLRRYSSATSALGSASAHAW